MPGDGLTFAVGVSRKIECGGFFYSLRDFFEVRPVLLNELILHCEVMFWINGAFFWNKVTNVSV